MSCSHPPPLRGVNPIRPLRATVGESPMAPAGGSSWCQAAPFWHPTARDGMEDGTVLVLGSSSWQLCPCRPRAAHQHSACREWGRRVQVLQGMHGCSEPPPRPMHTRQLRALRPLGAVWVFMLSPGPDVSVDQSNISLGFPTGYWNALGWLRGPRCRETPAWGGPCRGTRRMSRRSS